METGKFELKGRGGLAIADQRRCQLFDGLDDRESAAACGIGTRQQRDMQPARAPRRPAVHGGIKTFRWRTDDGSRITE